MKFDLRDDALGFRPWTEAGRSAVDSLVLADSGDVALPLTVTLARFEPGSHGNLHEHVGHEIVYIVSGELVDESGVRFSEGEVVVEEPGSVHRVSSPNGCVALGIRHGGTRPV